MRGVLFFTDETQMTGGTIKFYVDGIECPDTSGVGLNGHGGVFNCGLVGRVFKAICTHTCTPKFAVRELKLFKEEALSVGGTPYTFTGNVAGASGGANDIDKVFKVGSYSGANKVDVYEVGKGTAGHSAICIDLLAVYVVSQIIHIKPYSNKNYAWNYS